MGLLKTETTCCGVTLAQCHTLLLLGELKQVTIAELASTLKLDKSTSSRTIDGLVKNSYIERIIEPDDRRFMRISLTKAGLVKKSPKSTQNVTMVTKRSSGIFRSRNTIWCLRAFLSWQAVSGNSSVNQEIIATSQSNARMGKYEQHILLL